MDSAKDLDVFAKKDGKENAANIAHVMLGALCMVNARMAVAFVKQVSMESIALFLPVTL